MMILTKTVEGGYNCLCPGCQKRWNDGTDKGTRVDLVRCGDPKCKEKKKNKTE